MSNINRKGEECDCGLTTYHVRSPGCTPPGRATYDASTDPVPRLESRAMSLLAHLERAEALAKAFEAFTLEAKEQAVSAGLAFIAKRDVVWREAVKKAESMGGSEPATDPARIRASGLVDKALHPIPPLVGPESDISKAFASSEALESWGVKPAPGALLRDAARSIRRAHEFLVRAWDEAGGRADAEFRAALFSSAALLGEVEGLLAAVSRPKDDTNPEVG
jgi:hypothetical protein